MNSIEANKLHIRPQSRIRKGIFPATLRAIVLCLVLLIYTGLFMDLVTNSQGLVAYSLLLLGYLYAEAKNERARESQLVWMNPVLLASLFTFILPFGVTNILFFMPEDMVFSVGIGRDITPWMNQLMFLVVLGAVSMWIGYSSSMGRSMGQLLWRSRMLRKWIVPSLRINKTVLYAFLGISLIAKLGAMRLGVYGYSSSHEQMLASSSYTQYFGIADSLGKLALVGAALQCFRLPCPAILDRNLLLLVLGYEVFFGFLSGMKSAVVMPFIIVGFVHYSRYNRFPRWLIPVVVVGLMIAYAVIEPFRAARYRETGFVGTSLSGILSTMSSTWNDDKYRSGEDQSTIISILSRSNLTYIGSLGIEYAETHEDLPPGSPEFLNEIFLAPLHALIPRFLWNNKPLGNHGLWYNQVIMGRFHTFTSIAMSPFTYLYFAGGYLAVILGFLTVGILQRGLFDGLRHYGGGGLLVLLGLLATLVTINNAFNAFFISIIRFLPMLVGVQYLLLRRSRQQ